MGKGRRILHPRKIRSFRARAARDILSRTAVNESFALGLSPVRLLREKETFPRLGNRAARAAENNNRPEASRPSTGRQTSPRPLDTRPEPVGDAADVILELAASSTETLSLTAGTVYPRGQIVRSSVSVNAGTAAHYSRLSRVTRRIC